MDPWHKLLLFIFLYIPLTLIGNQKEVDERIIQRIHAHLILNDPRAALSELQIATPSPQSLALQRAKIQILARLGDSSAMLAAWKALIAHFPQENRNRELLEEMCWGILTKGAHSPALATRAMALIGAYLGEDARGVAILASGLQSKNERLRGLTVEIAGKMRDERLREEISRMVNEEKVSSIRIQVIRAAGQMQIASATERLKQILSNPNGRAEEQAVAIEALAELTGSIEQENIHVLARSNRAELRELACRMVAQHGSLDEAEEMVPLLKDHNPKIRAMAIQALGMKASASPGKETAASVREQLVDRDPLVSLSAAWLMSPVSYGESSPIFDKWLKSPIRETRLLAAGVLAATGKYGLTQMRCVFREHRDPYVQANLAMGLLGLRENVSEASHLLTLSLSNLRERWMWRERGLFRYLCPSDVQHKEGVANFPESVNQMTRLEILNALAIVGCPTALDSIKQFLQEHTWGISGAASSLLIAEGDDSTFQLIKSLQQDRDKRIRIQSALALALWGHDPDAVDTLQNNYVEADYMQKCLILEALGTVGHERSIPFLIDILSHPSEQIRLIAASSLIRCLNH